MPVSEAVSPSESRSISLPLLSVGEVVVSPQLDVDTLEPTEAQPRSADASRSSSTPETRPVFPAETLLVEARDLLTRCRSRTGMEPEELQSHLDRVIRLTTEVIALTKEQSEYVTLFDNAVITLAAARMELALHGHSHQAEWMAREADQLYHHNPTSLAAIESGFRVVELARELALRHVDGSDVQWTLSYARQSRLFAQRFPEEEHRASLGLLTAGQMCEKAGLREEAVQCYQQLRMTYPESLLSDQATRAQRRLELTGQPLVGFAGTTLSGGWLDVADLKGRTVVIAFWSGNSSTFQAQVEQLAVWKQTYGSELAIVGVNVDNEEYIVHEFLETHGFPGEVLFFSDPLLRGEHHPLVTRFGVREFPSYWLISADGIVLGAPTSFDKLVEHFSQSVE